MHKSDVEKLFDILAAGKPVHRQITNDGLLVDIYPIDRVLTRHNCLECGKHDEWHLMDRRAYTTPPPEDREVLLCSKCGHTSLFHKTEIGYNIYRQDIDKT